MHRSILAARPQAIDSAAICLLMLAFDSAPKASLPLGASCWFKEQLIGELM
jgi:hypothetical protein